MLLHGTVTTTGTNADKVSTFSKRIFEGIPHEEKVFLNAFQQADSEIFTQVRRRILL